MSNERGKNILLGVLIVGLVSMTVAYAALQTQLKIGNNDTQVTVQGGTWDVHFSGGTTNTTTGLTWAGTLGTAGAPVLDNTLIKDIKINFDAVAVSGTSQAASATYDFNIVNGGSIAAKLGTYEPGTKSCTGDWCSNITYSLTYQGTQATRSGSAVTVGDAVAVNDVIPANTTVPVRLTVSIPALGNQEGQTALPAGTVTATISDYTLIYVQD